MTTDEENRWNAVAASYDEGKGLPLEEVNLDDEGDLQEICRLLGVNELGAKLRLKRFIRSLQPQQQPQQVRRRCNTDVCIVSSNNQPVSRARWVHPLDSSNSRYVDSYAASSAMYSCLFLPIQRRRKRAIA